MNYFVLINACLYLLAAGYSGYAGRYAWGFVYASYGASALVLAYLEGRG